MHSEDERCCGRAGEDPCGEGDGCEGGGQYGDTIGSDGEVLLKEDVEEGVAVGREGMGFRAEAFTGALNEEVRLTPENQRFGKMGSSRQVTEVNAMCRSRITNPKDSKELKMQGTDLYPVYCLPCPMFARFLFFEACEPCGAQSDEFCDCVQ